MPLKDTCLVLCFSFSSCVAAKTSGTTLGTSMRDEQDFSFAIWQYASGEVLKLRGINNSVRTGPNLHSSVAERI